MRKFKKREELVLTNRKAIIKRKKTIPEVKRQPVDNKLKLYDYQIIYNNPNGSIQGDIIRGVTYQGAKAVVATLSAMGKRNIAFVCKRKSNEWKPM